MEGSQPTLHPLSVLSIVDLVRFVVPIISLEQIGSNYPIKTSISALWIFTTRTQTDHHKVGVRLKDGSLPSKLLVGVICDGQGSEETSGLLIILLAWDQRSLPVFWWQDLHILHLWALSYVVGGWCWRVSVPQSLCPGRWDIWWDRGHRGTLGDTAGCGGGNVLRSPGQCHLWPSPSVQSCIVVLIELADW